MTAEVFVDTSAWFPILHAGHADHSRLAGYLIRERHAGTRIITTNLVVAETHALLLRRIHRKAALEFLREIAQVPDLILDSNRDIEARAVQHWLERYDDQDFSLADAVSYEVMAERGIQRVLALDHHFAVAGFEMAT